MKNILRLLVVMSILTVLLSLGVITASAQSSNIVHITQIGETLSDIAWQYGTTVEALSAVNNIPYPYWIYYHQEIIIPATGGPTTVTPIETGTTAAVTPVTGTIHIVQSGENLFRIGLAYGWDVTTMAAVNGLVYPYTIYPGQVLAIPRQTIRHVVQDGETVDGLALWYGSTEAAIVAANNLANPNLIYIGQILLIP